MSRRLGELREVVVRDRCRRIAHVSIVRTFPTAGCANSRKPRTGDPLAGDPLDTGPMTQKRILRANTRKVARERDLLVRDAFRLYAVDPDDPEVVSLISKLVEEDPQATALAFFGVATELVVQLAEATGGTPADVLSGIRQ